MFIDKLTYTTTEGFNRVFNVMQRIGSGYCVSKDVFALTKCYQGIASFQITDSVLWKENRGGLYYLTNVTTIGMTSRVSQPVRFGAKRISRNTISLGALINNYCYGKSQAVIPATSSLFTYVRNQMANNSRFIRVNFLILITIHDELKSRIICLTETEGLLLSNSWFLMKRTQQKTHRPHNW